MTGSEIHGPGTIVSTSKDLINMGLKACTKDKHGAEVTTKVDPSLGHRASFNKCQSEYVIHRSSRWLPYAMQLQCSGSGAKNSDIKCNAYTLTN